MNKQLDMKRITILIVGSRGDLQPFLALGVGLQRFGHSVKIAAPLVFEGWIRSYGLDYAPVRFNPQEYLKNPEMQKLMQSRNLIRLFRDLERLMEPKLKSMFIDFWQASQGADAILCQAAPTGACDCAEKLGVPYVCGQLLPVNPTREFPCISMPPIPLLPPFLRGCYNRLTHLIVEQGMWMGINRPLNRWREQTLHLPPISFSGFYAHLRARRVPILFGYSPAVVPRPKDWADWQYVTGYWFFESSSDWQPPAALVEFLESGPPPVFIGFGSMMDDHPERLTRLVIDALKLVGQRGVLLSGWAGLGEADLPNYVFKIESIPFDWLFPRMAAVVHHGGAGTTGAGLRSGIPSIITPFIADQFGWGRIVSELGVGPKAIPIKKLTAERLAAAILTALADQNMRTRAAALGEKIRKEDGVGEAVRLIEQHTANLALPKTSFFTRQSS